MYTQSCCSQTGLLWIAQQSDDIRKQAEMMDRLKLHNEIISGPEISRRYPGLDYNETYTALVDGAAGVLDADRCLRAFQVEIVQVLILRDVIKLRVMSDDTNSHRKCLCATAVH
jgi:glycine/D-amino acid oxidase-like deaminating enzyme